MANIRNYQLMEKIGENRYGLLYRAIHQNEGASVLIKLLKPDVTESIRRSFIHGYYVEEMLSSSGIFRPTKAFLDHSVPFIVYEDVPIVSLHEYVKKEMVDFVTAIDLSIKIANLLAAVHDQQFVHRSIQPDNIFIHNRNGQIFLTGFEHATKLIRGGVERDEEAADERFIPYVSPEQTEKINRNVDHRSDLYSFGCVMYELFTGKPPFEGTDQEEMIYAHLATVPPAPEKRRPNMPKFISEIVMKLLEKEPENRYQSSLGLKQDLEKSKRWLYEGKGNGTFPLGEEDFSPFFEIPYRLFGRTEEKAIITETFEQVKKGRSEILFVNGKPGIGKTALIEELYGTFIKDGGIFLQGKYDMLNKGDPYQPIVSALTPLVKQIVAQGEQSIAKWKAVLEERLGDNLEILTGFIPEFEWITGREERTREFSSLEEQRRFQITFLTLLNSLAEKIRPIVIFLDDLHWADRASLDLIEYVFAYEKCPYLFVIGAYRDEEVKVGHPLFYFLERMKNHRRNIVDLSLIPLSPEHTVQLVQHTIRSQGDEGKILANFIYPLTEGNPLFIRQVLYSFYDDGFIIPNKEGKNWEVKFDKIKELTVDEHIVSFILKKIDRLPKETIELMKRASCIGNQFSLQDLVAITKKDVLSISISLWKALEQGFVIPLNGDYKRMYLQREAPLLTARYRFSHDRIQQAVYSSLREEEKKQIHYTIGKYLKNSFETMHPKHSRFIEMVNHLNDSQSLLSEEEKWALSRWNMEAGKWVKKNAAFEPALTFFNNALNLLPEDKWKKYHSFTYELTILTGESEYLNGNYKRAENLFEEAINHAKTPLEKLKVYNLQMILSNYINRFEQAVERGMQGLSLYSEHVPKKIGKGKLAFTFLTLKLRLWRKTKHLLALPELEDEERKQLLHTYILLNTPTFFVDQHLATFFMLRAVRFTLKYGNSEATSLVYNNYALILSAGFKDYQGSYYFGKLAIKHAEKYGNPNYLGRVYFVFGCFVNHWRAPLSENISYLERGQSLSLESGNLTVAGSSSSFIIVTYHLMGTNLFRIREKIFEQLDLAKKIDYTLSNHFLTELLHWIDILSKEEPYRTELPPVEKNENSVIMHYTIRLQMFYLMNEQQLGLKTLKKLEKIVNDQLTLVVVPEYSFYSSLIKLKWMGKEAGTNEWIRDVRKQIKRLKMWADHSPNNYEHKYVFVSGCFQLFKGKEKEGIFQIQRAIQLANDRGFVQDRAIASEWLGEYFAKKGMYKLASLYLSEAEIAYRTWGARAKANKVVQLHPNLSIKRSPETDYYEFIDMKTIVQATETLSKERKVDLLLKKYMEIILKNAGADFGHLIIFHKGKGYVMVTGESSRKIIVYNQGKPLQPDTFPMSVFHYVQTSKKEVYLDDAGNRTLFSKDPYIRNNQTKSLLCLPIVLNTKLFGILYLENHLSANVRFLQQVELLKTLSSQAAIFYINARLYENLEKTVEERTVALTKMNRKLEKKNNELAQKEQTLKELFSNISHDLKSPLSAIQAYIYAILDGYAKDPEREKKYLQKSLVRIEQLNHLIQDLFELANLQSGRGAFQFSPIGVRDFCEKMYDKFVIDVTGRELSFHLEMDENISEQNPTIRIDFNRMEQVFTNLISNALRHTNQGEIKIVAFCKDERIVISVQDTGEGIKQSDLPYVFDRFYTKSKKGHGIGLSITKEIVTTHGGKIWVESEYEHGSAFYIELPKYPFVAMKDEKTDERFVNS
ncbi:ATP-binding sensor histidine kinase [Fervidibacillus albus]|uniref:histidine kinase n=1 Tax=Fervidibacillus albus TaxID=2980026 RepID=A0A9E8LWU8_9BACI|nr:ATP-binding sensor histidine kinase [Fervidibacillus albus]WAA11031.1 trifunctional serine/threonine-protein kinase/ATP-binding protein/sensor histidine kinase [Fervidibacillus albus]